MEHYGATFRTFRQNKGYTLKQVATGIVSISFLSKFERGDSDISFSVMIALLDRMMVTYEEFYFLHNAGKSNAIEEFFRVSGKAYMTRDIPTLLTLKQQSLENYERTNHSPFHCNALLLDVYVAMIQNEPLDIKDSSLHVLTSYLFDIEVWGFYELSLYNSTMFLLSPELAITFSETIVHKSTSFQGFPLLHDVYISILLNTITYLTGGQDPNFAYEQESNTFIQHLKNSGIPETQIHARISLIQAEAFVQVRTGNRTEGIDKLERVVKYYEEFGSENLAQQQANYHKIFLQK